MGVRRCGIRWYGGTVVREYSFRKSKNPNPKPRQPHVGADSRVCPPSPKHRQNTEIRADTGGCPYRWVRNLTPALT